MAISRRSALKSIAKCLPANGQWLMANGSVSATGSVFRSRRAQAHIAIVVVFELLVLVALGFAFSEFLGRLKSDSQFEERHLAVDVGLALSALENAPGRWAYAYQREDVALPSYAFEAGPGSLVVGRDSASFAHRPSRELVVDRFASAPWELSSSPGLLEVRPMPEGRFVRACPALRIEKVVLDPGHGGSDAGVRSGSASESSVVRLVANVVAQRAKSFTVVSTRELSAESDAVDRARVLREAEGVVVSLHVSHVAGVTYWVPMGKSEAASYAVACRLSNGLPGKIRPVDVTRVADGDWRSVLRGRVGVVAELGSLQDVSSRTTEIGESVVGALSG